MKTKIATMIVALVAIALLVGCAANPALYRKLPSPVNKIVKAGPLSNIYIFPESKRNLKGSFPAHAPTAIKLAVGESVVLIAVGEDENSRRFKINPTWKCGKEGKISATKGETVTFTLTARPDVTVFVEATVGNEEGGIQVEAK